MAQGEPSSDGFTLIEVLVALAILSLSLTVLLAVFSQVLGRARDDEHRAQARVLAQSLLARAENNPPSQDMTGSASSGMSWRLHMEPYGVHDDTPGAQQAAVLSATVSWRDGNVPHSVTLTTLQLTQTAGQP